MARILVADDVSPTFDTLVGKAGLSVDRRPKVRQEDLPGVIGDFEALVVRSRVKVTREVLAAGKKLRVVARAGAGLDNIDVRAAEEAGVTVLNAPDSLTESVAELVFGSTLMLLRKLKSAVDSLREGQWERHRFLGTELNGKVMGVVGYGRIGARVARLAQAFGMHVIVVSRKRREEGFEFAELDDMLARSHVVSLHLPLNDETRGMISRERIRKMKPGAILVNTARGGLVDSEALAEAIRTGHLGGACVDVYEVEPPPRQHPLLGLDRVIATPHIGSATLEAQERAASDIAAALIRFFGSQEA